MKFKSDVDGFVCGVRFYKGTGNGGAHVGRLWTTSGQQLASALFTGETATGWQSVIFSSAVAVQANVTYIVSYSDPQGKFALNSNYFSSTAVDNAPLHAPSSGSSGGNGVYAFGVGNFPQASTASNFWVDVVFASPGPAAPSNVVVANITSSSLNVFFTDNATNETGIDVERKTGVGGTYSVITTTGALSGASPGWYTPTMA